MPSTKNKTSNGLSKSANAKSVAEGRKHLEEREICQQATELVNGYIKNMNKEFERGRQLYAQEKKRFNARQKGLIGCVQRRIAKKWFNGKIDDPAYKAFLRSIKTDYEAWLEKQPPAASEEQWKPFPFKERLNGPAKASGKRKADSDYPSTDFTDETEQYDDDVFDHGIRKHPDSDTDSDGESDAEDVDTLHEEKVEQPDDDETEEPASSSGDPMRGYLAQPVRRDNPKGKRSRFDKPVKGQQGSAPLFCFS